MKDVVLLTANHSLTGNCAIRVLVWLGKSLSDCVCPKTCPSASSCRSASTPQVRRSSSFVRSSWRRISTQSSGVADAVEVECSNIKGCSWWRGESVGRWLNLSAINRSCTVLNSTRQSWHVPARGPHASRAIYRTRRSDQRIDPTRRRHRLEPRDNISSRNGGADPATSTVETLRETAYLWECAERGRDADPLPRVQEGSQRIITARLWNDKRALLNWSLVPCFDEAPERGWRARIGWKRRRVQRSTYYTSKERVKMWAWTGEETSASLHPRPMIYTPAQLVIGKKHTFIVIRRQTTKSLYRSFRSKTLRLVRKVKIHPFAHFRSHNLIHPLIERLYREL